MSCQTYYKKKRISHIKLRLHYRVSTKERLYLLVCKCALLLNKQTHVINYYGLRQQVQPQSNRHILIFNSPSIILHYLSKLHRRIDSLQATQLGPRNTRCDSRGERSHLLPSRRGLTPRVSLECNPEIPVAPGEEHYVLDTSPDEVYFALQ